MKLRLIIATMAVVVLGPLSACRSIERDIEASRSYPETIRWPAEYDPNEASFFIHNAIRIQAPPEAVWRVLIDASNWPQWYEGASNLELQGGHTELRADTVFHWRTMGLDFVSTIREFEPNRRLSWESEKWVIRGYHGWLIIPTQDGCILITDESQNGILTYAQLLFVPNKLHRLHDIWLTRIKERAEARVSN